MTDAHQQPPSSAAAVVNKPPPELSSILTQVQTLQSDRERLQKELEEARLKMDKMQALLIFFLIFFFYRGPNLRRPCRRRGSARR